MTNPGQHPRRISISGLQSSTILLTLVVLLPALVASPTAQAQFKTLHTFTGGADGGRPYAAVMTDANGNLYGTTLWGGNLTCNSGSGCGVVYQLTTAGKETVLHRFAGGRDGAYPSAALIEDPQGNFYGTTTAGGGASGCLGSGCGTVFKIDTTRKETVLHRFTGGKDGGEPSSSLIMDQAGNFYGTTGVGGNLTCGAPQGCGVVYKMTAAGKETVLHSFKGTDGANPELDSLAMDANGNFYGTTQLGGDATCNCGVVFKLTTAGKETVLHTFKGGTADGSYPLSGVTLFQGSLYGTAALGGANSKGVLFKISNPGAAEQPAGKFSLLHSFGSGTDGASPYATVSFDAKGNLYGTTGSGGTLGYGTLYKVDTTGKESVVHNFNYSVDGGVPLDRVTIAPGRAPELGFLYYDEELGGSIQGGFGSGGVGVWSGH